MIIGINGEIGSGKDTVGKIWQWQNLCRQLPQNKVPFESFIKYYHENHLWEIKKFATKLKQFASMLTGVPVEKFEDQEFKKSLMTEEWWNPYYKRSYPEPYKPTYREFLQRLGTECIREGFHGDAWVNALFADYKPIRQKSKMGEHWLGHAITMPDFEDVYPNWIITDMRFPNEYEAVKEREGFTVKITRDLPKPDYETLEQKHPSETALNNHKFDYYIDNNGTIEELVEKVRIIYEDIYSSRQEQTTTAR